MTHFTLTRLGGSAIVTCRACGEASLPSRSDRVLDVWRREHDAEHRQQTADGVQQPRRRERSANPSTSTSSPASAAVAPIHERTT